MLSIGTNGNNKKIRKKLGFHLAISTFFRTFALLNKKNKQHGEKLLVN